MESNLGLVASLCLILFLTSLHAFFAIAEVALLRSQTAVLRRPEHVSKLGNLYALKLIQQPAHSIVLLQVGIAACLVGTIFLLFGNWVDEFLVLILDSNLHVEYARYSVLLLVLFVHVIIASNLARAFALTAPEKVLISIAPVVYLLTFTLRPLLVVLVGLGNLVLRPLGFKMPKSLEFCHSAADISRFLNETTDSAEMDEDEKEMLQGVFEFSRTVAREVMTPRTDLVTIPLTANLSEVVQIASESGQSRFPVRGEVIDDIRGILLARDLLPVLMSDSRKKEFSLARIMRKAYFIPDTKPIDDLLNEFKRRKLHMAIVLDEHGGVDGLVTLEDLLEEIVGEIFDESDTPEEDYEVDANGDILVDGGMLVFELNEHFELSIPEGDYDTIAGFIFTSLGRMPHVGDTIEIEANGVLVLTPAAASVPKLSTDADDEEANSRVVIVVEAIENNRISLVRIKPVDLSESAETVRSRAAS